MSKSRELITPIESFSPTGDSFEVRVATRLAGKRRLVIALGRRIVGRVGIGILADVANIAGVDVDEGPLKRAQRRLIARGLIKRNP